MLSEKYYKQNRNCTADFLKGIAVLLMIQVHVTELFIKPDLYLSLYGKISLFLGGPPAAPLFMAVMGYFLAGSKKSTGAGLKRGLLLIFSGFLLNIGLNGNLLYKIFSGHLFVNPYEYLFGVDILFLAGLSVIIITLLKIVAGKNYLVYAAIIPAIMILHPFLPQTEHPVLKFVNAYFYGDYNWSYFPLFPWFAYVLTGFVFGLMKSEKVLHMNKGRAYIISAFAVALALSFSYALDISSELDVYYHHNLLFYIWTLVFLVVITSAVDMLDENFGDNMLIIPVKFLGQNVTLAYVFQWLLIGNIATEVFKTFTLFEGIISFFAVTVVTYLLIFLYLWVKENYFTHNKLKFVN